MGYVFFFFHNFLERKAQLPFLPLSGRTQVGPAESPMSVFELPAHERKLFLWKT